jgi:hypothetical protein
MPYNTNNSVPSSDLRDFADNQKTMDEVVNSSSKEVTTRTGKKVKTLAGLQADVVAIGQSASQSAQAAANSATAAAQSAADAANSAAATGYVDAPFPDVWAPLSDDLRLLAGVAPADTITVAGTSYPLPTKSMSFTRSTTGTYIDKSGVLKTAAVNEPRFEREGLLMEGQSTNYILNSDDPSKWENGTQLTKTVLAADGYSQSITGKFVVNSEITVSSIVRSSAITVVVGDTVTTSGRAKCSSGLIRVLFRIDTLTAALAYIDPNNPSYDNKSGPVTITTQVIQDGYVYFTATLTAATAGSCDSYISANKLGSEAVMPVGAEFYLQMPQTEKNPVATSYIPTGSAAVTRSPDNWSIPAENIGYRTLASKINRTIAFEFVVKGLGPAANSYVDVLRVPGVTNDIVCRISASNRLTSYRDGGGVFVPYTPDISGIYVHQLDSDKYTVYFGGNTSTRTQAPNDTTGTASNVSNSTGPSGTAFVYHIRNLRFWHRLLSDIQIKGLR